MMKECAVCGKSDWRLLPFETARGMTTAGQLISGPLGKAQCARCGSVQKILGGALAETDFYERKYTYYERPGSDTFTEARYRALAQWIDAAIRPKRPQRVFDVGCGRGLTMKFLRELWPEAHFAGVEPYSNAAGVARSLGFDVSDGRLDDNFSRRDTFDLVYSTNVLQHTNDPRGFIRNQKRLLARGGEIVLTCPDATLPNIELLMFDQNISLGPQQLDALMTNAGMQVERRIPCPNGPLQNLQLVAAMPFAGADGRTDDMPTSGTIDLAYDQLVRYLRAWASLDAWLCDAIAGADRVLNFGASIWASVLAAYCSNYWRHVEFCLVDGFSGSYLDKAVKPFEDVSLRSSDVLVLAVSPYVQPKLAERFRKCEARTVAWNHIVSR